MKLYDGSTYWDQTVQEPIHFGKLERSIETEVLIVGGGMSGTLCAYVLSSHGLDVTVVDANCIGKGSSVANTGLLQYRSDKMLCEFADEIGEEKARLFYQMCLEAMDDLTLISEQVADASDYIKRDSIFYASTKEDEKKVRREYGYLIKYGFPADFLDHKTLQEKYRIDKSCAIRTWHDADVNPYKFIQALTKKNLQQGASYYENTDINVDNIQNNKVSTSDGHQITFKKIVLATGYTKLYPAIKEKCRINRTYAFCSEPYEKKLWKDDVMVWETRNPYLYFRTTVDHRIIAGGLDEETDKLAENDAATHRKASEIARQIEAVFPDIEIRISHAWNALFGKSNDGLPFIGQDPNQPSLYYVLGYEGNGTCYSMAGARIIFDLITGNPNPYKDIVKIDR
jgi:glycine/D-amino acid oxidase-like deaminating enzyme